MEYIEMVMFFMMERVKRMRMNFLKLLRMEMSIWYKMFFIFVVV